jgi:hypothetical protein
LVVGLVEMAAQIVPVLVIFSHIEQFNGWDVGAVIAVAGASEVMASLLAAFVVPNQGRMSRYIREGDLDLILIRPVASQPFAAPDANRLAELGLGRRELGAAQRAGALLRINEGVVLLPDGVDAAVRVLAELPEPFTVSDARTALGTTRRVAIPLLEYLDRHGWTDRLPDDRRRVRTSR